MENQETATYNPNNDQFYKQEVRLEEGIDVDNLFSGKGTTFTVKQETPLDDFNDFKKPELWDTNEISPIGIDPNAHKDGAFKGIEHLFTEKLTDDGFIIKQIIKPGSGAIIPSRAWVRIHYSIYAEGHDEPIDSTRLRSRTHDFIVGDGVNIPAVDISVNSMKKGEKARFLAECLYCYGEMGVPPRIPKKARLLLDIEVVTYYDDNKLNEYDAMPMDDRRDIPLDGVLKLAAICRQKGNETFKKNSRQAYNSYLKGYRILDSHSPADEDEEWKLQEEKIRISLNLAQACLEQGKTFDCRRYAGEAAKYLLNENLKNPTKLAKAHYTIYKSYMKEQKLGDAKRELEIAVKHAPHDKTIREAFVKLEKAQARENELERDAMSHMGEQMGWRG